MNLYSEIQSNTIKTYVILSLFFILITLFSFVLGKALGMNTGFVLLTSFAMSMILTVGSYFYSDKIVLTLHGAREAKREEFFDVYTVTENIALSAGIPKPKVYIISDPAPNAFATGRDPKHAVVAVTTGLVELMDRSEMEGVIAHEISHIKNYDIRLAMIVAVMVGIVIYMADIGGRALLHRRSSDDRNSAIIFMIAGIALILLAPLFATLLQLAISRRREFLADATAAYLTRYPAGLARALEKIAASPVHMSSANNGTAHLFIENPMGTDSKGKMSFWQTLFSTHPTASDRIAKLQSM